MKRDPKKDFDHKRVRPCFLLVNYDGDWVLLSILLFRNYYFLFLN